MRNLINMVNIVFSSCRICLLAKMIDSEVWRHITEIDDYSNNLTISDKIQLLSEAKPDTSSDLALLICPACAINLKTAYDFRIACRNSENIITNFVTQHKTHSASEKKFRCYYETKMNELKFDKENLETQKFNNDLNDVINIDSAFSEIKVELAEKSETESNFESDEGDYHNYNFINETNSSSNNEIEYLGESSNNEPVCEINKKTISRKDKKEYVHKSFKLNIKEKTFVCEICGNVYKKRGLLTDHMRWHNGSKDFKCEICGKAFLLNTYLARHIRTHTGIRNYKCSFCSRTFYTNGSKRAHEKVHTGERCYRCELCNRTFAYSQSLQRHMLVHSGVKPHKCEDCGKEFRQESHLKQHKATNIHIAKQQPLPYTPS